MNYALGHSFNLDDMFMNFPYLKLKFNCKDAEKINNNAHRDMLVKKVFRTCLKKIIDDVIDNNVTFELPTGAIRSEIHMNRVHGEDFKKARQNGKFKEIDFLNSLFSGYELHLDMYKKGGIKRTKNIYVDSKRKNKIINNTNQGMLYC